MLIYIRPDYGGSYLVGARVFDQRILSCWRSGELLPGVGHAMDRGDNVDARDTRKHTSYKDTAPTRL